MIPLGLYLMVATRRASLYSPIPSPVEDQEEETGDSLSGSR